MASEADPDKTVDDLWRRGTRAIGVEYVQNPRADTATSTKERFVAHAPRIVISAGTFGSPGILERSGIGARSVLEQAGVQQIIDLPGVGENYQGKD